MPWGNKPHKALEGRSPAGLHCSSAGAPRSNILECSDHGHLDPGFGQKYGKKNNKNILFIRARAGKSIRKCTVWYLNDFLYENKSKMRTTQNLFWNTVLSHWHYSSILNTISWWGTISSTTSEADAFRLRAAKPRGCERSSAGSSTRISAYTRYAVSADISFSR